MTPSFLLVLLLLYLSAVQSSPPKTVSRESKAGSRDKGKAVSQGRDIREEASPSTESDRTDSSASWNSEDYLAMLHDRSPSDSPSQEEGQPLPIEEHLVWDYSKDDFHNVPLDDIMKYPINTPTNSGGRGRGSGMSRSVVEKSPSTSRKVFSYYHPSPPCLPPPSPPSYTSDGTIHRDNPDESLPPMIKSPPSSGAPIAAPPIPPPSVLTKKSGRSTRGNIYAGKREQTERRRRTVLAEWNRLGLTTKMPPETLAEKVDKIQVDEIPIQSISSFISGHLATRVDEKYLEAYKKQREIIWQSKGVINRLDSRRKKMHTLSEKSIQWDEKMAAIAEALKDKYDLKFDAPIPQLEVKTRKVRTQHYSEKWCSMAIQRYLTIHRGTKDAATFKRLRKGS